jgi:hypothetical protein
MAKNNPFPTINLAAIPLSLNRVDVKSSGIGIYVVEMFKIFARFTSMSMLGNKDFEFWLLRKLLVAFSTTHNRS